MRLPIDDAVLLSLLVIFFAVQQRHRPETYFRFWLAGWVLVLLSALARVGMQFEAAHTAFDCFRQDALVCGGIAFQFSSIASDRRRRAAIVAAFVMAAPICFGLNIASAGWNPVWLLTLMVVVGEGIALMYAYHFARRRGWWLLALIAALGLTYGAVLIHLVFHGIRDAGENVVLSQIFLTASLLLLGQKKAGAGRWLGSFGFMGWGLSYLLMSGLLPSWLLAHPLLNLWVVPKYLVAFGMILRLFGEHHSEIAGLGTRYRNLYEDFRVLFQGNPHPMWVYDCGSLNFLSVNQAALDAYGFSESEFLSLKITDLLVATDNEASLSRWEPSKTSKKMPARHRRANGTVFDVDLTEHEIHFQGTEACFVLAVDITEREQINRELVYQAQHDVLTGLPNRVVLEDRLTHWLARCSREGSMGALLTIDIDHFKWVNDTHGHLVGDQCLKAVAERLRSRVRQVDSIARTGGEEFTIVIGNLRNREGAEKVCGVLLQISEEPLLLADGLELTVTISIGAAMYPEDGMEVDGLRRESDRALYEAKRGGRNRVVFASRTGEANEQMPVEPREDLLEEERSEAFAASPLSAAG